MNNRKQQSLWRAITNTTVVERIVLLLFHLRNLCFLALALGWLVSCSVPERNEKDGVTKQKKIDSTVAKDDILERFDLADSLSAKFSNKVELDTLLDRITHQEKVKVLAHLTGGWNNEEKSYVYFGNGYQFKLKDIPDPANPEVENTVLFDGNKKISFKDYGLLCDGDEAFKCESYGFNDRNSLDSPKIIEVCGKHFLYSSMDFNCNGVGCGCKLTLIYDLETGHPVFLENFRVEYDGFFISDFDNDNQPDILVISARPGEHMKGYDLEDFELRLSAFDYKNGKARPKINPSFSTPYRYELYGITPDYMHAEHAGRTYALTKAEWIKCSNSKR